MTTPRDDRDALVAALEPFAEKAELISDEMDDDYTPDWSPFIPVGAYRAAARALSAEGEKDAPKD